MAEERFFKRLETKERIHEADTDYLKKHGVKRVGHREVYSIKETKTGIEICGGSGYRYYFDDKEPEEHPIQSACIDIPKEFLPELKELLRILEKKQEKEI